MLKGLWLHRSLIRMLAVREVAGRYRGSVLGLFWSFVNPLLLLAVYTFVFSVVFKARWGSGGENRFDFALILFTGLLFFNLFAECINRAPSLILGNANYVKKVVFPLEILPWAALGSALFHAMVSLSVLLAALLVTRGLPWTVLLLPLVLIPLCLLTMGLSWILAALGVFLRDVGQIVGLAVTVLLFMSPVFYPVSALSPELGKLLLLNPLSFLIEQARDLVIFGRLPYSSGLVLVTGVSLLCAWLGFFWFQKVRKGFADVL